MRSTIKRVLCFLLMTAILLTAVSFLPARKVKALDYSGIEKLNTWQYYFARTAMSIALKDHFDSGILPSITVGQIAVEGGFAEYSISVIGKNFYGMKAYPALWSGQIYDNIEYTIYNSYNDLVNIKGLEYAKKASIWRSYNTWEEGIYGHSHLFHEESKYIPVVNATNYGEAALAIQNSGYAGNSPNYAANLIKKIESYGFDQLDFVSEDEHGIYGILMSQAEAYLEVDDTLQLTTSAFPEVEYDYAPELVWKSDQPNVATVDENGLVTAVAPGYTLITADFGDKEACCVVCVGSNAWVMDLNQTIYYEPDSDSDSMGKLLRGQPIHVNSKTVFESEDGNSYYAVTARNSTGKLVSGYVNTRYVYTGGDVRISIGTPLTVLHMEIDTPYQIPLEIHADELLEKEITWASSDEEVLTVDETGTVTPLAEGVSLVTVMLDGEVSLTITVYVGEAGYEEIVATAAVYVRDGCDAKYTVLGTIRKGQTVKLLCDLGDGWYRVLAIINGDFVIGYSYSRYFRFSWEEDPSSEPPSQPSESSDPVSESSETTSETSSSASSESSSETSSAETSSEETSSTGTSSSETSSSETSGGTVIISYPVGEVRVDSSLNVRKSPGTSGAQLVRIPDKTKVVVLEEVFVKSEPTYKDWYKVSFTFNKKDYEGYVAADFITLTGTKDVEIPDEPTKTDRFPVDDTYVRNVLPGMKTSDLCDGLGRTVTVSREGKAVSASDFLATGDTVEFYVGSFLVYTRTAVVKCDVNGDKTVDAFDYMLVKAHVLASTQLQGAFLEAAKVAGGTTVSAFDYMIVKSAVLGTYSLT